MALFSVLDVLKSPLQLQRCLAHKQLVGHGTGRHDCDRWYDPYMLILAV